MRRIVDQREQGQPEEPDSPGRGRRSRALRTALVLLVGGGSGVVVSIYAGPAAGVGAGTAMITAVRPLIVPDI